MKRQSKDNPRPVKTIWPMFWTKCDKCGYEFRFEKMYTGENHLGTTVDLCNRCCVCHEIASDMITNWTP